jgi:hypothetical protein
MPPEQIRWIIKHNYLLPHILLSRFTLAFPESPLIRHTFKECCRQCEESLLIMMKKNGEFGTKME